MHRRIPLAAAVAGALIIGGATTGATHALWRDQAVLARSDVQAGRLSYDISTPTGVTVAKSAGSTADTLITVNDTSLGKNIAQRITATIGSAPTGVTATVGTTCGDPTNFIDTTPASAGQTFCVRVTSSPTAVSGNVTVNLSSTQLPTAGWTTTPVTTTVGVTAVGADGPRGLSCTGNNATAVTLSWTAPVSGSPSGYELYYAATGALIKLVTSPAQVTETELEGNSAHTVGVRARFSPTSVSTNNPTVSISQNQGQGGRVTCGTVVNP